MVEEHRCPHCGVALRTTLAPRAGAVVLLGLALAGCPADDTGDSGASTQGTQSGTTGTTGTTGTGAVTGDTGQETTSDDTLGGSGGVEYGTPDTGIDDPGTTGTTGTTGTGGASTDGTTSVNEPEYGVPETTTG